MCSLVVGGLGFAQKATFVDAGFDEKIDRATVEAARRKFTPEFMKRIDKAVVFKTLDPEHLQQIPEIAKEAEGAMVTSQLETRAQKKAIICSLKRL